MKKDVDELLEHTHKKIEEIKKSETVSKVDVKNTLENLRSSLDYCAQYINEIVYKKKSKVYFPCGKTEGQFRKSINRNFPSLKKNNPIIYELIENLQPHKCDDDWLIIMCEATNEAKHNNALAIEHQKNKIKKLKDVSLPGLIASNCQNLKITNGQVNNETTDDFFINNDSVTITKKGDISLQINFEITENKKLLLYNYQCDLIQLLEKSFVSIKQFSENLYKIN